MPDSRRRFLKQGSLLAAAAVFAPSFQSAFASPVDTGAKTFFDISLAQWSLVRDFFDKKYSTLDFPGLAKKEFGISIVEYVNAFFKDKAEDKSYLSELLQRCKDNGVRNHLIMIDGEGDLGAPDKAERTKAVESHYKWVDAAKYLGCTTVRVNAFGKGTREEVKDAAVDGLSRLAEYAGEMNVIVENHGSYSSDGDWLLSVMQTVNRKNVGILPDFGNFCVEHKDGKCVNEYDKYKGTKMWMPFAKGISAKTFDFDASGNCIETDYPRVMKIIKGSGFRGIIGVEYEGSKMSAFDGIRATKALLLKTGS